MRTQDFTFDLPEELIAQAPLASRSASRLLVVDRGAGTLRDALIVDLPRLLDTGDLLVFNDTKVLKARLFGRKETGGRVELLVERIESATRGVAQVRASKAPKPGSKLHVGPATLEILGRRDDLFEFSADRDLAELLDSEGHLPLPPYIQRPDTDDDVTRYQTVYARNEGAVAAPTAGLHFDEALLEALTTRGIAQARVTLHVGAGTFQPVRVDDPRDHRMHSERFIVSRNTAAAHRSAREKGQRVVAVGTTALRALESCWGGDGLRAGEGETDLFIYPGGRGVHAIDALLTNFHLPESTLLMLVCALAGTDLMLEAYRHAVAERYRFFSYGDAMLIL